MPSKNLSRPDVDILLPQDVDIGLDLGQIDSATLLSGERALTREAKELNAKSQRVEEKRQNAENTVFAVAALGGITSSIVTWMLSRKQLSRPTQTALSLAAGAAGVYGALWLGYKAKVNPLLREEENLQKQSEHNIRKSFELLEKTGVTEGNIVQGLNQIAEHLEHQTDPREPGTGTDTVPLQNEESFRKTQEFMHKVGVTDRDIIDGIDRTARSIGQTTKPGKQISAVSMNNSSSFQKMVNDSRMSQNHSFQHGR